MSPTLDGATCLDLFAGSGALAFEALSRGASSVVAIDSQREVVAALNRTRLQLDAHAMEILQHKAELYLSQPADRRFDIVFVDPPFDLHLHQTVCDLLDRNQWLSSGALIYVETIEGDEPIYPRRWIRLKQTKAGNVDCGLLQAPAY